MTDFDAAVSMLQSGSRQDTVDFLGALTPQQRKALGPKFRRWLTHGSTVRMRRDRQSLAVIATADGVNQARVVATHGEGLTDEFVEDAVRLLTGRAPAWLPDLVNALLEEGGRWNWRLARGIVRAGLVPTPDQPDYFLGTIQGVPDFGWKARRPLVEHLNNDAGLIGDHLLTMLSTEGAGRALAFHDQYLERRHDHLPDVAPFAEGTWRVTLITLVGDDRLDRGALLDTILAAAHRDWAPVDLGWYVGLHDALEPTIDEVADRQSTYDRLLTVDHGPWVKTAQRMLLRLLPDARFDPEPFLAASRATLARGDKASVMAHLRLLGKLAEAHPGVRVDDAARIASDHPRADVRDQAATLLTHLGAVAAPPLEAPAFTPVPPEQRPPAPAISPVGSADELAEVLLSLLEEVDPIEMERAIDGLLRLAEECPATADLLMARAQGADYYQDDPRIAARVLALAWLTPVQVPQDDDWPILLGHTFHPAEGASPETFVGAIGRRLTAVAQAVRTGRHTSVALPFATDFRLDAGELNRRLGLASGSHPVPEMELVVALLRVPAHERAAVAIPPSLGRSAAIARARSGHPPTWIRRIVPGARRGLAPGVRVVVFLDEHGVEGDAAAGLLARQTPERTVIAETEYGEYVPQFEQTLALGAALLPHDHDVLAAQAHPYLQRDLGKDRACSVPVIDAIAAARSVNGPPSSSALVLALAAKDARGRTAAQDAILDLARYGVLDGEDLGRQAALLLQEDLVVGQRVSSGLTDCARATDAALLPLLSALEQIMPVLPGRRDAGAFVELAADLADRTGRRVTLPSEFHELAAGKSSSALAKAARRLLTT